MTQHAELPIERLRADLAGQVIAPGDQGTTRDGRSSCPRSTGGPR